MKIKEHEVRVLVGKITNWPSKNAQALADVFLLGHMHWHDLKQKDKYPATVEKLITSIQYVYCTLVIGKDEDKLIAEGEQKDKVFRCLYNDKWLKKFYPLFEQILYDPRGRKPKGAKGALRGGAIKRIVKGKGVEHTMLLDKEDAPIFDRRHWYVSAKGYVIANANEDAKANRRKIWFHREVMRASSNVLVKHLDRNKLNNTKKNLLPSGNVACDALTLAS